jgi:hypothetical protein
VEPLDPSLAGAVSGDQPSGSVGVPPDPAPDSVGEHTHRPASAARNRRKPAVPAWEDVLLGVRSSGER